MQFLKDNLIFKKLYLSKCDGPKNGSQILCWSFVNMNERGMLVYNELNCSSS